MQQSPCQHCSCDCLKGARVVVCSCVVLHRNNTSDYYINNKRMNVKEVTTLLKSKGIDLDNNRFLILQVLATRFCT